jgi:hypothetical protein
MKLSLEHRLSVMRDFTLLQMDRVGDLAKSGVEGSKDAAREWVNYFENTRVLDLLCDEENGVLTGAEKRRFNSQLRALRGLCHPLDVPNYQSDLAAIRGEVDLIVKYLGLRNAAYLSVLDDKIIQFPGVKPSAPGAEKQDGKMKE